MKGTISTKILGTLEKIKIEAGTPIDPKEFFQKRDGLYVWPDFIGRIVSKAEQVKTDFACEIESWKLEQSSTDEQIEQALEARVFTESEACAVIADLISKQSKGEEGTLLNNGYANLFYTPSFVVDVDWFDGRWSVSAWHRDGNGWRGDGRVFSPAN